MKPCNPSPSRGALPFRLFSAVVTLLLLPDPLPGADGPAAPDRPPPKPYTLYLGTDLSIDRDGKLWPVRDVQRNSFVIEVDGKRVPVRDTDLKMKIDSMLKMTTAYATIADLKAERAYTPANDPRHHAREAMAMAEDASASVDLAVSTLNNMQGINGRDQAVIANWDSRMGPPPTPSFSAADLDNAANTLQRSLASQGSDLNSVPDAIFREQVELGRELFDAFSLSFEISSRKPLTDPYLVVMVRFREKPDNPKTARLLVYAQVLPPIDEKPQAVRLFRGGFPRGYQLENYQIHVYDRGTEIATSAAAKQMAMTRDEAFQFANVDYAIRNRDKTLPPAPTKAFWPTDLPARLPAEKLGRSLFVKVGKDGRASAFYDDEACTRPVSDAELEAVRPDLRFHPALEKGKPAEGVVTVNLGRSIE